MGKEMAEGRRIIGLLSTAVTSSSRSDNGDGKGEGNRPLALGTGRGSLVGQCRVCIKQVGGWGKQVTGVVRGWAKMGSG